MRWRHVAALTLVACGGPPAAPLQPGPPNTTIATATKTTPNAATPPTANSASTQASALPATCARDAALDDSRKPKPLSDAGTASLEELSRREEDPTTTEGEKWRARYGRAWILFRSKHYDEAIALAGPIAFEGPTELTEAATELYLGALVAVGRPCLATIEGNVPKLLARSCSGGPASQTRTCDILRSMRHDLRQQRARILAETDRARAAADFNAIFDDTCVGGAPKEFACDEVAYNAGIAFLTAGEKARARTMLAKMKDPRNKIASSPLVLQLECRLSDGAPSERCLR